MRRDPLIINLHDKPQSRRSYRRYTAPPSASAASAVLMCTAIAGCVAVFFWVYDATAHRRVFLLPALARDVGAGPRGALAATILIPPEVPAPDLNSPAVALTPTCRPRRPNHRRLPRRAKAPRPLKNRRKPTRRRRKSGSTWRNGCCREPRRPMRPNPAFSGPRSAGSEAPPGIPAGGGLERLATRPAIGPALQMTNAPDAQLGFPAPRRVFTLMASIGSKTLWQQETQSGKWPKRPSGGLRQPRQSRRGD